MTKKGQDLEQHIADDKYWTVSITKDGESLPLAGAAVDWYLSRVGTFDVLLHKSTSIGGGVEILSPASAGEVEIHLDPEDTEDLDAGQYDHSAIVTLSSGDVYTVATGKLVLIRRVRP